MDWCGPDWLGEAINGLNRPLLSQFPVVHQVAATTLMDHPLYLPLKPSWGLAAELAFNLARGLRW